MGTLMRHYVCQHHLARTPALGTQCVLESPRAPSLVASGAVALQRLAGRGGAPTGAVPLAPVALAAHQHLYAAARAQEESGGLLGHGPPSANTEGVLDGFVHRCNNQAAPGL